MAEELTLTIDEYYIDNTTSNYTTGITSNGNKRRYLSDYLDGQENLIPTSVKFEISFTGSNSGSYIQISLYDESGNLLSENRTTATSGTEQLIIPLPDNASYFEYDYYLIANGYGATLRVRGYIQEINVLDSSVDNDSGDGDGSQGKLKVKDLPIGSIIQDPTSVWEFRPEDSYTGDPVKTEPVKWVIAAHDHHGEGKTLLVAAEAIGKYRFNNGSAYSGNTPWEAMLLREWLGTEFYDHFSEGFKSSIEETEIQQASYQTPVMDTVFVLSTYELGLQESPSDLPDKPIPYFSSSSARQREFDGERMQYWTRTHHKAGSFAYVYTVLSSGSLNSLWNYSNFYIVPAVNITSESFIETDIEADGTYNLSFTPPGKYHDVVVESFISNLSPSVTATRNRVATVSSNVGIITASPILGRSQTFKNASVIYPIESEARRASAIAVGHVETRAGPIISTSSRLVAYSTVTVTSYATPIKSHSQRRTKRKCAVTFSVKNIHTNNPIRNAIADRTVISTIKPIAGSAKSTTLRFKGIRLINAPLGTVIKDPNTLYSGQPIEWIVVAQSHPGYPEGTTTLLARYALSFKPYSGAESGVAGEGPTYDYSQRYGVSDWRSSDIRAWLNQKEKLGRPVKEAVYHNEYSDEPGFLNEFNGRFIEQVKTTNTMTNTNDRDDETDELIYVTTQDKIFFLSRQEIGMGGANEGSSLPEEVYEQIRIAYPTQKAIDTDNSGAIRYKEDPTGWYTRSSNKLISGNSAIVRDILYARPGYSDVSMASIEPNRGSVAIRPALNIKDSIYLSDAPDEDSVHTIIYDPIVPNVEHETVTVTSCVKGIKSKAHRVTNEERNVTSYLDTIKTSAEPDAVYQVMRTVFTKMSPITHKVTTNSSRYATVNSHVDLIKSTSSAIKKGTVVTTSYMSQIASRSHGKKNDFRRTTSSYMAPIRCHVSSITSKGTTANVGSRMSQIVSSVSSTREQRAKAASYVSNIGSNVTIETIAAKKKTISVKNVVNAISSSNRRYVRANVVAKSYVSNVSSSVTRASSRTVSITAHLAPLNGYSNASAKKHVVTNSYVEPIRSHVTTRENNGKVSRTASCYVERLFTRAYLMHKDGMPTAMVSEDETKVKLSIDEVRTPLYRT